MTAHPIPPLPERIAALPRDERGYPIPYIILRDNDGKPMFTVNDQLLVLKAIRDKLCHICGQSLEQYSWFVGGPGAALLNGDIGVYIDGPMHHECMRFAMQACPHMLGRMTKPLAPVAMEHLRKQGVKTWDNTIIPGVPEIFLAVQAYNYTTIYNRFLVDKPYRKIEYWRSGELMPRDKGARAARQIAHKLAIQLSSGLRAGEDAQ